MVTDRDPITVVHKRNEYSLCYAVVNKIMFNARVIHSLYGRSV